MLLAKVDFPMALVFIDLFIVMLLYLNLCEMSVVSKNRIQCFQKFMLDDLPRELLVRGDDEAPYYV